MLPDFLIRRLAFSSFVWKNQVVKNNSGAMSHTTSASFQLRMSMTTVMARIVVVPQVMSNVPHAATRARLLQSLVRRDMSHPTARRSK